jgi:lysozyme family protein
MTTFDRALKHTLGIEGDYSDNPADSGGKTRFGITEATARAYGYTGDMRFLPLDVAKNIYYDNFWKRMWLDRIAEYSEPVALELFDTAVNCGQDLPGRHLQRILNIFNNRAMQYPDIAVDGQIGANTLASLVKFLDRRGKEGEKVLVEALNSMQGAFYTELAERRPKDEAFTYGWFKNRVMKRAE